MLFGNGLGRYRRNSFNEAPAEDGGKLANAVHPNTSWLCQCASMRPPLKTGENGSLCLGETPVAVTVASMRPPLKTGENTNEAQQESLSGQSLQ